jgi:anti-sigma B factor antagonist
MLETEVLKIESDIYVVALKGRLTLGIRLSLLEAEVNTLTGNGARKIVLDLEGVEYADSAALGVLLHATSAVRAKSGQLLLAAPNERLQDLFRVTNTAQLLTICPSRADCISQLQ